jgi:hypothetical protein
VVILNTIIHHLIILMKQKKMKFLWHQRGGLASTIRFSFNTTIFKLEAKQERSIAQH